MEWWSTGVMNSKPSIPVPRYLFQYSNTPTFHASRDPFGNRCSRLMERLADDIHQARTTVRQ